MNFLKKKTIYLDYASSTPVLIEARKEMDRFWSKDFYNASSIYTAGTDAKRSLTFYREKIAKHLGVGRKNVIFTSGSTESDNLAIWGAYKAYREKHPDKLGHIIISSIEHPAVMETAKALKDEGVKVSIAEVDETGIVSALSIAELLRIDTFIVSIGMINGEIGTLQPISRIGRVVKEYRKKNGSEYPYMHTDASQSICYEIVSLESLNVDIITIGSDKIYGPKGIGAIAVRAGITLRPITWGGGQEFGLRPGTESLPLVAGFSKALDITILSREEEFRRISSLRNHFISELKKKIPNVSINGPKKEVSPAICSVSIPGVSSEMLLLALDKEGVMVSVGSACSSNSEEAGSYVIRAIGKNELADSTLRFSFGKMTTKEDLDNAIEILYRRIPYAKISA